MNLNKDDVLLLIQEYQKQRILWDPKDKWHFNKNKKNYAWGEIARCIDIDVEDAKKKISSLLGSFRREKAKARKTVGTGKGAKDIYKSDWFAFNRFAFLMDKDDPKETISSAEINDGETIESSETSIESSEVVMSNATDGSQVLEESSEPNIEPPECCSKTKSNQGEAATFVTPSTPRRKRAKVTEKEDPRIEKAFQFLQQPIPGDDSSSIYAKYLADQLKKFNPETKAILIHKINALIFEAEMGKYRMQNPSYVPSLSPSVTSPSPGTSLSSPASTPPFSSEVLESINFPSENTQSGDNHTSSERVVASELGEFIYFIKP